VDPLPDLSAPPFSFPPRYRDAAELVRKRFRSFSTTSVGRLFDCAAALLGFTRETTYEGQAAMWVEQLARKSDPQNAYSFPLVDFQLNFRPLLADIIRDRLAARPVAEIARAFQLGVANGTAAAARSLCAQFHTNVVVLSGGVFQNDLLLSDLQSILRGSGLEIWTNHAVPTNDGGISLGQAAMAAFKTPSSRSTIHDDLALALSADASERN
jgi:hydrogenase maturation protein HypF